MTSKSISETKRKSPISGNSAPQAEQQTHPLAGMAFLSFEKGEVVEQGEIISVFESGGVGFAVLQYFEWLQGSATFCRLREISSLSFSPEHSKTYRLFENSEERNAYYEARRGNFAAGSK
jgi:hypothetical protein